MATSGFSFTPSVASRLYRQFQDRLIIVPAFGTLRGYKEVFSHTEEPPAIDFSEILWQLEKKIYGMSLPRIISPSHM